MSLYDCGSSLGLASVWLPLLRSSMPAGGIWSLWCRQAKNQHLPGLGGGSEICVIYYPASYQGSEQKARPSLKAQNSLVFSMHKNTVLMKKSSSQALATSQYVYIYKLQTQLSGTGSLE